MPIVVKRLLREVSKASALALSCAAGVTGATAVAVGAAGLAPVAVLASAFLWAR